MKLSIFLILSLYLFASCGVSPGKDSTLNGEIVEVDSLIGAQFVDFMYVKIYGDYKFVFQVDSNSFCNSQIEFDIFYEDETKLLPQEPFMRGFVYFYSESVIPCKGVIVRDFLMKGGFQVDEVEVVYPRSFHWVFDDYKGWRRRSSFGRSGSEEQEQAIINGIIEAFMSFYD